MLLTYWSISLRLPLLVLVLVALVRAAPPGPIEGPGFEETPQWGASSGIGSININSIAIPAYIPARCCLSFTRRAIPLAFLISVRRGLFAHILRSPLPHEVCSFKNVYWCWTGLSFLLFQTSSLLLFPSTYVHATVISLGFMVAYSSAIGTFVISRARSLGPATPSHVHEQCDMLTLPLSIATLIMT